ncbi:amidohydrolase family protein [Piscinibacter sp.]|uniref:amidohydrolase family protein n=1 Tax=Piscinibacter sp. TaxID=1903157 RepID=UPI0039E45704
MKPTLLCPEFVLRGHDSEPEPGLAVLVSGKHIAAIGAVSELRAAAAERIDLPGCMLMPGFVNAHQHGRGVSQIQLGYPDQRLELWMAQRRSRGVPDIRAIGLLAAAEMLRNGVTCAVHADLAYGSGDYEAELRACVAAYDESGLRACVAVGVCDQGAIVFPQAMEAEFLAGLPAHLRARLRAETEPPYAADWAATSGLMDRLMADYADRDRLSWCYGPSGPQWVTDESFRLVAADARRRGINLHIHAMETVAQFEACRRLYPEGMVRHLRGLGAVGPNTVFAHGVFLTDDDLDVIAECGARVATNPGSNLRLCDGTARVHEMMARGIRVGVGSDNSTLMDDEDLLSEARVASRLVGRRNWETPARASARQTIEMLTTGGAAIAGFDGRIGRLASGWCADLVALSLDTARGVYLDADMPLLEAVVARSRGSDVRLTMVAGQVLYRDGHFTRIDLARVRRDAAAAARRARLPDDAADIAITHELKPYLARFYSDLTRDTRFPDMLS